MVLSSHLLWLYPTGTIYAMDTQKGIIGTSALLCHFQYLTRWNNGRIQTDAGGGPPPG